MLKSFNKGFTGAGAVVQLNVTSAVLQMVDVPPLTDVQITSETDNRILGIFFVPGSDPIEGWCDKERILVSLEDANTIAVKRQQRLSKDPNISRVVNPKALKKLEELSKLGVKR